MSVAVSLPPQAREFDFWVGSWAIRHRVLQADGSWRVFEARTTVAPDLDGAILVEHWDGVCLLPWEGMTEPEPRKALSVRAYDPVGELWHIHWIDTRGRKFIPVFSGGFAGGRGEFFADLGGGVRSRITFRDITPDSVVWENAVEEAGGWRPVWVMDMRRESEVGSVSDDPARLQMRPGCECCDRDLPASSADARICSLECTFCAGCAEGVLGGRCPNCGGELVRRPARPDSMLAKFPSHSRRVLKAGGCIKV